jgi:hypothetical protein
MGGHWWDWIGRSADVLSVLTFLAAFGAWRQIRRISKRYQALIRIPEHTVELQAAASAITEAAPQAASNPYAVRAAFSTAEGKLTSVKGWIGGRFSLDGRRRELVLEIIEVRNMLRGHQKRGATIDRDIAQEMYLRVSQVTQRVDDYVQDRRLEDR